MKIYIKVSVPCITLRKNTYYKDREKALKEAEEEAYKRGIRHTDGYKNDHFIVYFSCG